MSMTCVYISGRCTGLPDSGYPAFHAAAAKLRALGYTVESPAEGPELPSWEAYMRRAIRQMLLCDEVVVLPGWSESRGATEEVRIALMLKMPVRALVEALERGIGR